MLDNSIMTKRAKSKIGGNPLYKPYSAPPQGSLAQTPPLYSPPPPPPPSAVPVASVGVQPPNPIKQTTPQVLKVVTKTNNLLSKVTPMNILYSILIIAGLLILFLVIMSYMYPTRPAKRAAQEEEQEEEDEGPDGVLDEDQIDEGEEEELEGYANYSDNDYYSCRPDLKDTNKLLMGFFE